jgi:hypothetical protein
VDVLNQENQKSYNQIDVGFAVELELKEGMILYRGFSLF